MCHVQMGDIDLRRSRRKTLSLEVTADARVVVRAPYDMPTLTIRRFVEGKRDWILEKQQKARERQSRRQEQPPLTEAKIRELAAEAARVLPERVRHFAALLDVDYGRISIRCQRTRWGSCSSKGDLNFNCLLMLMPPEIQDYVVVHELCHRKFMDHSAGFWAEVEKIVPDHKERRAWLRENAPAPR